MDEHDECEPTRIRKLLEQVKSLEDRVKRLERQSGERPQYPGNVPLGHEEP